MRESLSGEAFTTAAGAARRGPKYTSVTGGTPSAVARASHVVRRRGSAWTGALGGCAAAADSGCVVAATDTLRGEPSALIGPPGTGPARRDDCAGGGRGSPG